jgi:hypothetical protein
MQDGRGAADDVVVSHIGLAGELELETSGDDGA